MTQILGQDQPCGFLVVGAPSPARSRRIRWCGRCAKDHAGAMDVSGRQKCESCRLATPSFGLPAEGTRRWCGRCAAAQEGAINVAIVKCEGCGLKGAYFGLPAELRARWCGGCGAAPEGAVRVRGRKKCED